MIRLCTAFWLVVVSATGFAMFAVKYEVQSLADELSRTVKQADDTEKDIRVLDAEWAFLNRPEALANMNRRYLSLGSMATKQLLTTIADVPLRPAPASPPPSEEVVAGGLPPVAASTLAAPVVAGAAAEPAAVAMTQLPNLAPQLNLASTPAVTTVAFAGRGAPEPVKPAAVKGPARSSPPHRPQSLDELIAQVTASR
jgi:hypothetical protein